MTDSMIPPPPPKPEEPGVLEDLIDIFTSPAAVFARRAKGGGTAMYFIVVLAMSGLGFASRPVMDPIFEAQMSKGLEASPQARSMNADQKAQAMAFQRKLFPVYYVVGPPVALFVTGIAVWVFGKLFGAAVTFGGGIVIASLAYVPRLIGSVVTMVQALLASDTSKFVNQAQLSVGPAWFMDPTTTSAVMLAAAARLDLLVAWSTVLIAIAYMTIGKLPKGKAIAAAAALWAVAGLFAVWGASRSG